MIFVWTPTETLKIYLPSDLSGCSNVRKLWGPQVNKCCRGGFERRVSKKKRKKSCKVRLSSLTKPKISTLWAAAHEPIGSHAPAVSPPAPRGENEGGTLMGGPLPHMVPHSAVCALHLIAVALSRAARRSHSPGHFFFTAVMWSSRRRLEPHYIFIRDLCGTAASLCTSGNFPRWIDQVILVITVFIHLLTHAAFSISNRHFYLLSKSVKWALSTYAALEPLPCTYLAQRDSHTSFLPG